MKRKRWKILLMCIVIAWITLQMALSLNMQGSALSMKNIEALAADEEGGSGSDCVAAEGTCLKDNIIMLGMTLED